MRPCSAHGGRGISRPLSRRAPTCWMPTPRAALAICPECLRCAKANSAYSGTVACGLNRITVFWWQHSSSSSRHSAARPTCPALPDASARTTSPGRRRYRSRSSGVKSIFNTSPRSKPALVMLAARTYIVLYWPVCLVAERFRPNRTSPTSSTRTRAHPFGKSPVALSSFPTANDPPPIYTTFRGFFLAAKSPVPTVSRCPHSYCPRSVPAGSSGGSGDGGGRGSGLSGAPLRRPRRRRFRRSKRASASSSGALWKPPSGRGEVRRRVHWAVIHPSGSRCNYFMFIRSLNDGSRETGRYLMRCRRCRTLRCRGSGLLAARGGWHCGGAAGAYCRQGCQATSETDPLATRKLTPGDTKTDPPV